MVDCALWKQARKINSLEEIGILKESEYNLPTKWATSSHNEYVPAEIVILLPINLQDKTFKDLRRQLLSNKSYLIFIYVVYINLFHYRRELEVPNYTVGYTEREN